MLKNEQIPNRMLRISVLNFSGSLSLFRISIFGFRIFCRWRLGATTFLQVVLFNISKLSNAALLAYSQGCSCAAFVPAILPATKHSVMFPASK
jgi:hypothetical protein